MPVSMGLDHWKHGSSAVSEVHCIGWKEQSQILRLRKLQKSAAFCAQDDSSIIE